MAAHIVITFCSGFRAVIVIVVCDMAIPLVLEKFFHPPELEDETPQERARNRRQPAILFSLSLSS